MGSLQGLLIFLIVLAQPSWASLTNEVAVGSAEVLSADYRYREGRAPVVILEVLSEEELARINPQGVVGDVYSVDTISPEKLEQRIACAGKKCAARAPRPSMKCSQSGVASTYGQGDGFHGRQTANQEIFDKEKLTAAHRTLPFGKYVRVTNPNNFKSVVVRINDRGPFKKGRIIDLSTRAANLIGMGNGIAKVQLECL